MSSNLDVTSLVKNDRRSVELRSVIQVKPILSTQPHESDICEGGKHQRVQRLHDSGQLWQTVNTSPQMVCSLSEYQRQQGSLHTEQEELFFQLCCSSLDVDERTSLFILFRHHLFPSDFIYLLFFLELWRTNRWNNLAPTWSCRELEVRMRWMFDKFSRFWQHGVEFKNGTLAPVLSPSLDSNMWCRSVWAISGK